MATGSVDQTAPDGRGKRSRREVLAGVAGVLGGLTAQTLGKFTPAQAGSDGDVVLGADNQSTAGTTGVQSSAITGLHGRTTNSGNSANTGVSERGRREYTARVAPSVSKETAPPALRALPPPVRG